MENLDLPLTLEDRDEWGDAVGNVKHRQLLASYCPLQNITPQVCTQKNTNLYLLYVLFVHLFACRARSKTDLKNYGNLKCRFPLQHFFFVWQHYPSMLLTTYREDPRIPLAGVLKYTDLLKKAIGTHISSNPKPGMSTLHILSHP